MVPWKSQYFSIISYRLVVVNRVLLLTGVLFISVFKIFSILLKVGDSAQSMAYSRHLIYICWINKLAKVFYVNAFLMGYYGSYNFLPSSPFPKLRTVCRLRGTSLSCHRTERYMSMYIKMSLFCSYSFVQTSSGIEPRSFNAPLRFWVTSSNDLIINWTKFLSQLVGLFT